MHFSIQVTHDKPNENLLLIVPACKMRLQRNWFFMKENILLVSVAKQFNFIPNFVLSEQKENLFL